MRPGYPNILLRIVPLLLFAFTFTANRSHAQRYHATPADMFTTASGFQTELVYDVPNNTQGSWVSLTVDPKGRLLACDQYGGLFRIDVSAAEPVVEKMKTDLVGAQGLLCAFGSLYANVNVQANDSNTNGCGLWRLTDTDGDDQYDKKEHLVPLEGGSEHGPHALLLSPDGQRILMCAGNNTPLPKTIARSRVPQVWSEDHLLGRMPDARGHNADRMAPGGFIASVKSDGSDFELIATGFRNEYDIALNREGDLFTYDADMEWDIGTPWYRPTRVNHVISGAEFGWRNGTGKWPAYYPDSFGAAVNIGPGSPTGICFGYGAKFPAKYQNCLFVADWSYGNIYAVHLEPDGSTYTGTYETFATAAPLPATDMVVHPDGMLYFTVGGRGTQSGLYRIRYIGDESNAPFVVPESDTATASLRKLRQQIEAIHVAPTVSSLDLAIENLGHEDRAIRFASRIAIELCEVDLWRDRILKLEDHEARILGVVALARHGSSEDKVAALASLNQIDWGGLSTDRRTDLLRAYSLIAIRLGGISDDQAKPILEALNSAFPVGDKQVDRELAALLVYLDAPQIVDRVILQMEQSPSQESQIHYAFVLREAKQGWTPELYKRYFSWFREIQSARGGASFGGFIENIKNAALVHVSEQIKSDLAAVIHPPAAGEAAVALPPRPLVKEWTVDELFEAVTSPSSMDLQRGKTIFAEAQCYKCHRMGYEGGILGPDLTGAGGRFTPHDLLVAIIQPSKEISDQYGATQFLTDDGRVVVGRVVNLSGDNLQVMTNMLDPASQTNVDRGTIEQAKPAKNSMMPQGLLDTFTKEEIADLVAYLRSGGKI